MKISAIVCMDQNGGVGKNGRLPWRTFPLDMARFTFFSKRAYCCVMGQRTFDAMRQPLRDRHTVVVSSRSGFRITPTINDDARNTRVTETVSLQVALDFCLLQDYSEVMLCGGTNIYHEALEHNLVDVFYVTEIFKDYSCDTFIDRSFLSLSRWDTAVSPVYHSGELDVDFTFRTLTRKTQ